VSVAPRLPNFFIAGAPNTGTTSLYFYMRQHPQVFMSPVKEPTFFGAAEFLAERQAAGHRPARRGFLKRAPTVLSWEDYVQLFRGAREEIAVGEASPRYLLLPAAPRAIRARVPHARLVFILRDPTEWLLTRHRRMFWREPAGSFRSRFLAAMDPANIWARSVAVGRYATHLQRFFDVFPREQLQIHLYEDFRADGRTVVGSILGFLGIDPAYPIDMSHRHNQNGIARVPVLEAFRQWVPGGIAAAQWLPLAVRRMLRRFYFRHRPDAPLDPADRALVIDYYRDEILRTGDLIGRDLSAWLR